MSRERRPPRLAEWLLGLVLPSHVRDALLGDLDDAFAARGADARRWYWGQALRALWPPTLIRLVAQSRNARAASLHNPATESIGMPTTGMMIENAIYDARLALRGFGRRPLWAGMIMATLALGIGANATMFGILDRLLLRAPAHIADPDRVVLIHTRRKVSDDAQTTMPYVFAEQFARRISEFADVAVATPTGVVRRQYYPSGHGVNASRVAGSLVSGNYFAVLGTQPSFGRFFTSAETSVENPQKLAVLGYGYWQRQFGGSRSVLGETIEVGASRYTIVGVAPSGFTGTELRDVDVWLPVTAADDLRQAKDKDWATSGSSQWLLVIARLKPGADPRHAEAVATTEYRNWARARMTNATPARLARLDSTSVVLGSTIPGRSLWSWGFSGSRDDVSVSKLLGGVSFLVLLIACANVANLLFVRALGRRREIAVRLALGVSRRRLVSQLVIEGVLLSLGGIAGAMTITALGSQIVRRWLMGDGAWTGGAVNGRVLAFTVAVGVITGVATSLIPALQVSRPDLTGALKSGAREGGGQPSAMRSGLLIAQAALAIVLLAGAGMFIRSLRNAGELELGVDVEHVLIAQVNQGIFGSSDNGRQMFDQFAEKARTVSGVTGSAIAVGLPFSMSWMTSVTLPDRELPKLEQLPVQYAVTPGYFDVLGIKRLLGREFSPEDRAGAAPVAMINETMARLYWPNASPIGACVRVSSDTMPCATVIGVVTNTRRQDLVEGLVPQVYRPLDQMPSSELAGVVRFFGYTVVARSSGPAYLLVESLRRAMQSVSATVPYVNVQPMRDLVGSKTRSWQLGARVFTAFGALALLLAGIGLFSVVAFTIGQRMHEMGVRTALGAQRTDLLRLTVVRGVSPAVAGIVIGIGLTLVLGRFLESMLFETSPRDAMTLGIASGIMFASAVAASLVPAVRASRVDPTIALRAD